MTMDKVIENIRAAAKEGGVWLALIVACTALTFAALAQWNPAERAAEDVAKPVIAAMPVGLFDGVCKSGWEDTSNNDLHIRNVTCYKDPWLVVLNEDGEFSYATAQDGSGRITEDPEVAGW